MNRKIIDSPVSIFKISNSTLLTSTPLRRQLKFEPIFLPGRKRVDAH